MGNTKHEIQARDEAYDRMARAKGMVCGICGTPQLKNEINLEWGGKRICAACLHSAEKI